MQPDRAARPYQSESAEQNSNEHRAQRHKKQRWLKNMVGRAVCKEPLDKDSHEGRGDDRELRSATTIMVQFPSSKRMQLFAPPGRLADWVKSWIGAEGPI